jgi:hypothetical protein
MYITVKKINKNKVMKRMINGKVIIEERFLDLVGGLATKLSSTVVNEVVSFIHSHPLY